MTSSCSFNLGTTFLKHPFLTSYDQIQDHQRFAKKLRSVLVKQADKKPANSCGTASQVIYKKAMLLFTLCSLSLRQCINCISFQFMGLELVLDSGSNFQPDSNSTLIQ